MSRVDFAIIGAAKSGSTSLTNMLRESDGVFVPDRDEVNYWAWDADQPGRLRWGDGPADREWPVTDRSVYEGLFVGQPDEILCGECSVVYLESAFAIERLVEARPDVKLICSLREPVSRAVSGYAMGVRYGKAPDPHGDAFDLESDRVRTGEYARLLRPVLEVVDPRQLLLLRFDDIANRPESVRTQLGEFLGLDPARLGSMAHANQGGVPQRLWLHRLTTHPALVRPARRFRGSVVHRAVRQLRSRNLGVRPVIPDSQQLKLERHYRPQLTDLQELTGFDVSEWVAGYQEGARP